MEKTIEMNLMKEKEQKFIEAFDALIKSARDMQKISSENIRFDFSVSITSNNNIEGLREFNFKINDEVNETLTRYDFGFETERRSY